eukprot:scaffold18247_cov87-Isochrysis_galbana.AAC.1
MPDHTGSPCARYGRRWARTTTPPLERCTIEASVAPTAAASPGPPSDIASPRVTSAGARPPTTPTPPTAAATALATTHPRLPCRPGTEVIRLDAISACCEASPTTANPPPTSPNGLAAADSMRATSLLRPTPAEMGSPRRANAASRIAAAAAQPARRSGATPPSPHTRGEQAALPACPPAACRPAVGPRAVRST